MWQLVDKTWVTVSGIPRETPSEVPLVSLCRAPATHLQHLLYATSLRNTWSFVPHNNLTDKKYTIVACTASTCH